MWIHICLDSQLKNYTNKCIVSGVLFPDLLLQQTMATTRQIPNTSTSGTTTIAAIIPLLRLEGELEGEQSLPV